jgi:hypothetical protein
MKWSVKTNCEKLGIINNTVAKNLPKSLKNAHDQPELTSRTRVSNPSKASVKQNIAHIKSLNTCSTKQTIVSKSHPEHIVLNIQDMNVQV